MTLKEDKKLKDMGTMTAGVTPNKLEFSAFINLHGHSVHITHTDAEITTVQYANLERRTFDTHVLNSFLELGTFPVGTALERATVYHNERAIIEAVTGDCCYQVRIVAGSELPRHATYSYADFIAWHMDNGGKPVAQLETDTDLLEALDETTNPFEEDLKQEIARLEKELERAEANGQSRINALLLERSELTNAIASQKSTHATIIAGYEQDIAQLEAKSAILNPVPTCKEYSVKTDTNESDINKMALEGWQIQHSQFMGDNKLNVVFVRDLPTAPAPKVMATDAAIYGMNFPNTTVSRPPITQSPMPAHQIIIHQPTSRALTHNGPKPGETKRIPSLADIQARRQRHDDELAGIVQRNLDAHEAIRKQYANSPRSFNHIGTQ